ncbi:MAG: hypothetical protein EXR07_17055 [Acetobacteraceae bacterium]|nr:hypothetical protein [Acetobacteraceae bacterium]
MPEPEGEKSKKEKVYEHTPWNQLEAGIMFSFELPVLVFREDGIEGGVFDIGGHQDLFVQRMPDISELDDDHVKDKIQTLFQNWASDVKSRYYMR